MAWGAVPDQTPAKLPGATSAFMISVPTTCSAANSVSAMPTKLSFAPNLKAFCVRLTIFCTPEASLDSSLANRTNLHVQKLDINENMAPALAKRNPDANAASGWVAVDGAETLANVSTTALIVVRMTWHHQLSQPTRHNANALLFPGSVARAICFDEASSAARWSMAASTDLSASGAARSVERVRSGARRSGGRKALAAMRRVARSVLCILALISDFGFGGCWGARLAVSRAQREVRLQRLACGRLTEF